jgi:hypothetical protein
MYFFLLIVLGEDIIISHPPQNYSTVDEWNKLFFYYLMNTKIPFKRIDLQKLVRKFRYCTASPYLKFWIAVEKSFW